MTQKTWDDLVPLIFGPADLKFAPHQSDADRAFEWLTELRNGGVSWTAASQQMEDFLKSKGAPQTHIQSEIVKAEAAMKVWLDIMP